jgi:hypothetical protein
MSEIPQWPDDFPDPAPVTDFDVVLVAFFDQIIASGGAVHADRYWSLFGFSRDKRMIDFVRRGRLRRSAGVCWEVWPNDDRKSLRLGALFGIRAYACVVISGIDDLLTVTERWLNGMTLDALLDGATFWDKMDTSNPLEPAR